MLVIKKGAQWQLIYIYVIIYELFVWLRTFQVTVI